MGKCIAQNIVMDSPPEDGKFSRHQDCSLFLFSILTKKSEMFTLAEQIEL